MCWEYSRSLIQGFEKYEVQRVLLPVRPQLALLSEDRLIESVARHLGISVIRTSLDLIERHEVPLDYKTLVAGNGKFVLNALRALDVNLPEDNPYPQELAGYLGRRVQWHKKLRDAIAELKKNNTPTFIRPAGFSPHFRGFTAHSWDDHRLAHCTRNLPVWTSEPLQIRSMWRAYIIGRRIVAITAREQDPTANKEIVQQYAENVLALLETRSYSNFAIDIGILATNELRVIRVVDGFAIRRIGEISEIDYFKMLAARWFELLEEIDPKKNDRVHVPEIQ